MKQLLLLWLLLTSGKSEMCIISSNSYQDDYGVHYSTLMCVDEAFIVYDELDEDIEAIEVWGEQGPWRCDCETF